MRKQEWQAPELEVLDVRMTAAGPGIAKPDGVQPDEDEVVHHS